jgi:hypothetical protein
MALSAPATVTPPAAARAAPRAAPVPASRTPARARLERPLQPAGRGGIGGVPDPLRTRPALARALSRHRTRTGVVPNIPL